MFVVCRVLFCFIAVSQSNQIKWIQNNISQQNTNVSFRTEVQQVLKYTQRTLLGFRVQYTNWKSVSLSLGRVR